MKKKGSFHKIAAVLVLVLFAAGCGNLYFHGPKKARKQATMFLNLIYNEGKTEECYVLADKSFRESHKKEYLSGLKEKMDEKFGKLEGIRADFYLLDSDARIIEIFYTGISEKKMSYHTVALAGDGLSGYMVAGITLSEIPHKEYRTARKFK